MTTYVYETVPQKKGQKVKQYEIRQSMSDDPLTVHPETGEPIKRVISGGYGYVKQGGMPAGGHCCGGSCGCSN